MPFTMLDNKQSSRVFIIIMPILIQHITVWKINFANILVTSRKSKVTESITKFLYALQPPTAIFVYIYRLTNEITAFAGGFLV